VEEERKLAEQQRAAAAKKKADEKKRLADKRAEEQRLAALAKEQETAFAKKRRFEEQQLRKRYHGAIRSRVEGKWRLPKGTGGSKISCQVNVVQIQGGEIVDVDVLSCSPNDRALRKSVENAVWAANPLPKAPRENLFDRRLKLTFTPRG